ncbi:MAG: cytochrome c biogenesis heme-transporting ATPase CcmA [Gammaproteobacteria bacterium]|nr:cytochrome c biogenesis heme-transporting ATPase CcmA [Gammaproteobacteria bacterium]
MLEVINLTCTRGDRVLFENLSFSVQPGELLYVQGVNGSGKTTLLRTLCGLSQPADGEIRWQGSPIRTLAEQYRDQLCYVGHVNGIQGDLTAAENLKFGTCVGNEDSDADIVTALERVGLTRAARLPAKYLSQGQKRRLALARLLLTSKPLWILDEPLTALDVHFGAIMSAQLATHVTGGGLVLITSHQELAVTAPIRKIRLDS